MRLSFKHIGLLIGCLLVIISFLFFARKEGTYSILLLSGLAIAFTFYLTILFGRSSGRSKLFWTAIVILVCVIQRLTEPLLINCSYRIYIDQHLKILSQVNNILKKKTGNITILKDTVITEDNNLDSIEH